MAPAEEGRRATERLPDGRFEYMEGIGHLPFLEAPEETARLIRAFVAAPGEPRGERRRRRRRQRSSQRRNGP